MAPRLCLLLLVSIWFGVSASASENAAAAVPHAGAVTIELEIVVLDARGEPVVDLRPDEVDVVQEARHQLLESFTATGEAGHYAIRYLPDSNRPARVAVWVQRKGTKVRGPKGDQLEPRVVRGLSGLEASLVRILDERTTDGDLGCSVAVLRFGWGAGGRKHILTAEVPLAHLAFQGLSGRLQVLARIKGPDGPPRYATLDRALEVRSEPDIALERMVWTSSVTLTPGSYVVDMLVNDPNAGRHLARSFPLEVAAARDGIQMSSVTALQGRGPFYESDGDPDDALVYEGVSLMPKLDPTYEQGADARLGLFATLYPDPRLADPVSVRAELRLDGRKVADLPTVLPKPEPNGEIRWAANMGTRALPLGLWQLVLVATQGGTSVSDQASFAIVPLLDAPAVRIGR